MYRQKEMIAGKIAQIEKMRGYLIYSNGRMRAEGIADKKLNAINHEYEDNAGALSALTRRMLGLVEPLMRMQGRAVNYCQAKLGVTLAADTRTERLSRLAT
ncbi:MAG: hypothetical protein Q8O25_09855 [Sulfurisoma sp.]|nr:hypothetical protein [Sulfurisoma sp.]